jgi:hypothetical protein
MKPVVNHQETIGKVVGRRTQTPDPLSLQGDTVRNKEVWRSTLGGVRIPRGVYRFHTHEEADAWLWQMITRPRPS